MVSPQSHSTNGAGDDDDDGDDADRGGEPGAVAGPVGGPDGHLGDVVGTAPHEQRPALDRTGVPSIC